MPGRTRHRGKIMNLIGILEKNVNFNKGQVILEKSCVLPLLKIK
jgi:hypothetical protein